MDGPGTITWEEFLEEADQFLQLSAKISDHWELRGTKTLTGGAYLVRCGKVFVPSGNASEDRDIGDDECDFKVEEDPFEAKSTCERPLLTEHHILWSMSYGVPVMYFNGWFSDFPGVNMISVEIAQTLAPGSDLRYMELSQAIHPILGTPFLQLHPCCSQELLKITHKSKNKLVSWLSMMAPAALGLKLPAEYCELTISR